MVLPRFVIRFVEFQNLIGSKHGVERNFSIYAAAALSLLSRTTVANPTS